MDNLDKEKIWHEVLESIKVNVSQPIFTTWFTQTHIVEIRKIGERYLIEVGCASSYVKSMIERRYPALIQESLSKSVSKDCDVIFVVRQLPAKTESLVESTQNAPLFAKSENSEELKKAIQKSNLRKGFTFENFAVSATNQMAYAAAEAVAENLGHAYNPLFIWGGVGVGKTHLMNAVGHKVLKEDSGYKIVCCTGEDFTNDIVEGIRHKSTQDVRKKYRKLDVLLVDDIQFIAGKDAVQVEFFHTFNSLVASGGQIIFTSDRPPSDISNLEDRLRSRFEAGLIVDISSPDFELRCAILQIKAKQRNLEIPSDLIQIVSANIQSAREIEGFLTSLSSEVHFKNQEVSKDLIESLLSKRGIFDSETLLRAQPIDIISAVSKYYSIGKKNLLGTSRARPVARPRQILMYILRTQLDLPYQEVGRLIGGRDHTTVMHAVDKITNLVTNDVQIREDIRGIKNMF